MIKKINEIPLVERPYRSCVGIMVFNKNGNVFCGQRLDNKVEMRTNIRMTGEIPGRGQVHDCGHMHLEPIKVIWTP